MTMPERDRHPVTTHGPIRDSVVSLSVLDTATVEHGQSCRDALVATVELACRVEKLGYRRFWVAEHHGSRSSASAAPAVLVAEMPITPVFDIDDRAHSFELVRHHG